MTMFVPYRSEAQIERDAEALLAEFARDRSIVIQPPIPIEDIIEKYLKLPVEFDDLDQLFGIPPDSEARGKILGCISFPERRIIVDQRLDPEEDSFQEGRYRFTLAHEGAHWRLHRKFCAGGRAQIVQPTPLICRSDQRRQRVEWQADSYAACVLMPKDLVISAWRDQFGNTDPYIYRPNEKKWGGFTAADRLVGLAGCFSEKFLVSNTAMRIRLEQVGLIRREGVHQQEFAVAS